MRNTHPKALSFVFLSFCLMILKNLLPCVLFYRFKLLFRETVSGVLSDLSNNSLGLLLHRLKPEQAQIWVILAFPTWCTKFLSFILVQQSVRDTDNHPTSNVQRTFRRTCQSSRALSTVFRDGRKILQRL